MKVKPKLWQDSGTSAEENYKSWLKRGPRYIAGNRDVTNLLELQCHQHCSQTLDAKLWDLVSVMLNLKMLSLSSLLSRSPLSEWECFSTAIVDWKCVIFFN